MKNLTKMVEVALEKDEESRNSDIRCMLVIWNTYFKGFLKTDEDGDKIVKLKYLNSLPREDHIKRIRAVIQNEQERFLPTLASVRKRRLINEEKWQNYLKKQK